MVSTSINFAEKSTKMTNRNQGSDFRQSTNTLMNEKLERNDKKKKFLSLINDSTDFESFEMANKNDTSKFDGGDSIQSFISKRNYQTININNSRVFPNEIRSPTQVTAMRYLDDSIASN